MAKKTKSIYTEIVMVVDRSGSMESCKVESENGLNHFVDEQKKEKGSGWVLVPVVVQTMM